MNSGFMNPLSKMNVKQQLILLLLIMFSPIFILYAYGNLKAEQILKHHVTNAYVELNKQNFTLINRDIDTVNKVTSTVIQNPLVQQLDVHVSDSVYERVKKYEKIEKILNGYSQAADGREPIYYSLYVYDPDDAYFFAPNYPQVKKSGVYFVSNKDKPEWFDEAIAKKGKGYLRIIEGMNSQDNEKMSTLAYVRAINNISKGETIGVLVVTKMDAKIGESLQTVDLPDGNIYFTDWDNRILASTEPETGTLLQLQEVNQNMVKPEGVVDVITSEYIYVMNYNHALEQKLIYRVPVKALLQQQNEMKQVIQLISIVYAAVVLLVMAYFWKSLMMPLQRLAFFVRKYVPGHSVPVTPRRGRNDEVSVLITSTYDMARRLNDLVQNQYQMEIREKEAQLQILYQQINPHLLYNTLESIYWKSSLEGNVESAEMIKELSKLMKISLSRGRELITLEEELEHAKAYIKLQQMRYDYSFKVVWDISGDTLEQLIPKITLQPLIENAIIHGVKNMEDDGVILIRAWREQGNMLIRIEDNGYKMTDYAAIDRLLNDELHDPSTGYGIRNIHQRIRLHFGPLYGLKYMRREEGGTSVTIILPADQI
ncbi:cache domain-containing sensor histidine kinase [Paenibacillus tuaregi]|uniref:cache domain-containing sensor histidine kinase n=1 Tax=Paenibacillus tuaregi TaxID=1816681 RepID=UPI000837E5CB|nr:sensor histidine kinase [Paenibacillus tuaregi]